MFIEMYLIRLIAALKEYGTLSKVAEELHTSQSAVSRAMQKLESLLEVPLFDRTKNRIALNENGLIAARYAALVLEAQERLIAETQANEQRRMRFSVASLAIQPAWDIIELAKRVLRYAQNDYEVIDDEAELIRRLDRGECSVIVLLHPLEGDYVCIRYKTERLSVVLDAAHPLAERASLCLRDLKGMSFIVYDNVGFWERVKREKIPDARFLAQDDLSNVEELIQSSHLAGFISNLTTAYSLPEGKKAVPLRDAEVNPTFYVICLSSQAAPLKPLLSALREEALCG